MTDVWFQGALMQTPGSAGALWIYSLDLLSASEGISRIGGLLLNGRHSSRDLTMMKEDKALTKAALHSVSK